MPLTKRQADMILRNNPHLKLFITAADSYNKARQDRKVRSVCYVIAFAYGVIARSLASYVSFYGTVGLGYFFRDIGFTIKGIVTLDMHLLIECLAHLFWL